MRDLLHRIQLTAIDCLDPQRRLTSDVRLLLPERGEEAMMNQTSLLWNIRLNATAS